MTDDVHGKTIVTGPVHEAPFYIPAVDAPARSRRNLKHNDMFAVFDSHGDIGASAGGPDGLFDHDTRYLSHLEFLIAGSRPLLLHSAINDDNLNYSVDLTNPDIYADGRLVLAKDTVHIARTIYLSAGSLRERMTLKNHGAEPVSFVITISFASDYADIFEVRGVRRERRGATWTEIIGAGEVHLGYRGLDHIERRTQIVFDPAPTRLAVSVATFEITLQPHERQVLFVSACSQSEEAYAQPPFFRKLAGLKRAHRALTSGIGTVETSNSVINEVLCRSVSDLYMLMTTTEDGPYPYAGIPWYSTTFGRDGIITALQTLWIDPSIAKGVLKRLARLQATTTDSISDSAPGKILHEMRGGEMAHLNEVPFKQYYGTVDATPLFVMLAGAYGERTGDWDFVRSLWPAIEAALRWVDLSVDADGFLTYARATEFGLANQGWKDSHDSIFHADGRLAEGPIALVEVQGYCYAARLAAAACAQMLELPERASALTEEAARLRQRFEDRFWCEEIGTYALAIDGKGEQCRVRSSNAGHALWTGIASDARGKRIASQLMDSTFYSGWGVRTIAQTEVRYNPMSYHNGSIWPHDNALIAYGLSRMGARDSVIAIFEALMRATGYLDLRRIPELYCGFPRRPRRGPTLYPAACSPQAWAAAAPFALIQSMLGLEFLPEQGELRLTRPVVAPLAGAITLRNVTLKKASADFTVRSRHGGGASVEVLKTRGDIRISLVA